MEDQAADDSGVFYEYQVIGMTGRPTASGVYSTRDRGDDAYQAALAVQRARGGQVKTRQVVVTRWADCGPEHRGRR